MAYGLRVWNSSGVLTLDVTDRITSLVGIISFSLAPYQDTVTFSLGGATPSTHFAYTNCFTYDPTYPDVYMWAAVADIVSGGVRVSWSEGNYNATRNGTVWIFKG